MLITDFLKVAPTATIRIIRKSILKKSYGTFREIP